LILRIAAAAALLLAEPGDNLAFVDRDATTQVLADAGTAVVAAFSFDGDQATHDAALAKWCTSNAISELHQLLGSAPQRATATLVAAGVQKLDTDRATLLVFIDQSTDTGNGGAATFIELSRVDGQWKIDHLASAL
jgi:hypothetical protein